MLILINNIVVKIRAKKWGNSLGIRLPNLYVKELGIDNETELNLAMDKDKLIITKEKKPDLDKLLDLVTKENIHGEINWGNSVGKEIW